MLRDFKNKYFHLYFLLQVRGKPMAIFTVLLKAFLRDIDMHGNLTKT